MSNEPKTTVETEEKTYYHGGKAVARKFAFASGELVYNLPWMLVSSYLAFFMTDVALIPASAVSILFLICRIWDAINDPMIGSLADRTNTKMGRYRPWMLGGAIGLIPLVVLLFWAHPDWSVGARTAYGCILYFVTVVASTSWNIPFSALNGVISPYPRERASFSSYRIFISSIACSVATALFIPFVTKFSGAEGNTVRGYLLAALVICCMAIPFVFTSILGTKEVVKAPPQQKQKFHAKEMAACFTKNPPLLIVCFAFLVYGFLNYGRMTVGMYYFTYVWGDVSLFTLYATVHYHLNALRDAGLIEMDEMKKRAISLPDAQRADRIPVVGVVTAGVPILATENIEGYIPWDGESGCFVLRVRGDSMIGAGILDGDKVVVRPQPDAENGQIVVALLDDSATVKRLKKTGRDVWLMPENPSYEPIPGNEAKILGRVKALIREY